MGLLSGTRTYLCGPIEFTADCVSWRTKMHEFLGKLGVKVYDPLIKPDWYPALVREKPSAYVDIIKGKRTDIDIKEVFDAMQFVVDVDLRLVNSCDWLICYLPKGVCTVGTIEELVVAANAGKPVFVFGPDKFPSTWIVPKLCNYSSYDETFFDSIESLQTHIEGIDNGTVSLDGLKWIFLSYFNHNIKLKVQ